MVDARNHANVHNLPSKKKTEKLGTRLTNLVVAVE